MQTIKNAILRMAINKGALQEGLWGNFFTKTSNFQIYVKQLKQMTTIKVITVIDEVFSSEDHGINENVEVCEKVTAQNNDTADIGSFLKQFLND